MTIKLFGRKNWVRDPAGWARSVFARPFAYGCFATLCVLGTISSSASIWILASRLGLGVSDTLGLHLNGLVFSFLLPFLYLRAAYALVSSERRQDGGEGRSTSRT